MKDFGDPLFLDIIERVGRVNRKADQNDVRIRVGERAQAVIVFLTCRIPKSEFDMFAINIDIGDVVLEDSGNIDLRECSFREDDKKASLTAGTVTDDDKLTTEFGHCL